MLARCIETALGRALLAALWHDAGRVRLMAECDVEHLLGGGHLKVQRKVHLGHQPVDVLVGDMAAVLARWAVISVRAGLCCHDRSAHRIGVIAAARVPYGRDMVDIDAEAKTRAHAAARLPGLMGGIAASSGGTSSTA